MSHLAPFSARIQSVFQPNRGSVVCLVDDLLGLCREQGIQLDWQANRCHVRPLGAEPEDSLEAPIPRSVFRAILARMAALCNEQAPDSVSPYGGDGEFSYGADPSTVFRVLFVNTPTEQRLEIRPVADSEGARKFTVLLRDNRIVTVRGHALQRLHDASSPDDSGSYGIVSRSGERDVLVALFPVGEVIGIFSGEIRVSQASA